MKFKEFVSLLEKKHHTVPKTEKEKDLAALAEPKDKITHKDVLVGRGVLAKEEVESTDKLNEVLSKSAPIEDWIHDFVHSDNPKFKGKTKEERRKMAIAAYYGAHGKSKESQNESIELQIENILNELDVSTIQSYKEKAEDVIKQTKPFTRKGEYRDIAKNIVARKEKGVEMAKQRLQQSDLKQS